MKDKNQRGAILYLKKMGLRRTIMSNKIAVLLNEEKQLASFVDATLIYIYEKACEWQVTQMIETKDLAYKRENDIKNFTLALIEKLKCCKVIVGTLILGVPYYLLIRAGYELCEAPTFSMLLLEQIYEDYYKIPEETSKKQTMELEGEGSNHLMSTEHISRSPIPLDESDNYFIDMIAVQKAYPEMSSKKILLPFFSNAIFRSLKVNCSHVMPWLENYLEQNSLIMSISRGQGIYTLSITHKVCSS